MFASDSSRTALSGTTALVGFGVGRNALRFVWGGEIPHECLRHGQQLNVLCVRLPTAVRQFGWRSERIVHRVPLPKSGRFCLNLHFSSRINERSPVISSQVM